MATYRHDIHKRLWDILADEPYWEKSIILREFREEGVFPAEDTYLFADCAACDACRQLGKGCDVCPLLWPDGKSCGDADSLHDKFVYAKLMHDEVGAKEIAKKIRDLPFNPKTIGLYDVRE